MPQSAKPAAPVDHIGPSGQVGGVTEAAKRPSVPVPARAAPEPAARQPDLYSLGSGAAIEADELESSGAGLGRIVLVSQRRTQDAVQVSAFVSQWCRRLWLSRTTTATRSGLSPLSSEVARRSARRAQVSPSTTTSPLRARCSAAASLSMMSPASTFDQLHCGVAHDEAPDPARYDRDLHGQAHRRPARRGDVRDLPHCLLP